MTKDFVFCIAHLIVVSMPLKSCLFIYVIFVISKISHDFVAHLMISVIYIPGKNIVIDDIKFMMQHWHKILITIFAYQNIP